VGFCKYRCETLFSPVTVAGRLFFFIAGIGEEVVVQGVTCEFILLNPRALRARAGRGENGRKQVSRFTRNDNQKSMARSL
jgi:hypothetical protein